MKRKINRVGTSTLTVSLPSKWARQQGLKPGDEVEVVEKEKELMIGTKPSEEYQKTDIKLELGNDWYVSQVIRNFYLAGFDEVKVRFTEEKILTKVQNVLELLLGFEIVEYGKGFCIIKNISSGSEAELDFLLRKIFLLDRTIFETALEQLKTETIDFVQIENIRNNLQRFANLYRRTITKTRQYNLIKNREIYTIVSRLTMVGNNLLYAHKHLSTQKKVSNLSQIRTYLEEVLRLYNTFYDAFYSKNMVKLSEMNDIREELINNQFVALCKVVKREYLVPLHFYAEIVRLIATTGGSIIKYNYS